MKREIKFRMWNNGEMFYAPHYLSSNLSPYITLNGLYYVDGVHQKDMILMQFTGIHDKNGKEIYEGDVVRYIQHLFNTPVEQFPIKIKEVKWLDWEAKWNLLETNAGESNFEIIGNIYENPELLNK